MLTKKELNGPRVTLFIMGAVILIAGVYGFGSKFEEFIHLLNDPEFEEGRFALIPILNYILASSGFICLFFWAASNGMFKDIERPKFDLMDRERKLDLEDGIIWKDAP